MSKRLYVLASTLILVSAYIVPYTVLQESRSFVLYFFWLATAFTEILLARSYIEKTYR